VEVVETTSLVTFDATLVVLAMAEEPVKRMMVHVPAPEDVAVIVVAIGDVSDDDGMSQKLLARQVVQETESFLSPLLD